MFEKLETLPGDPILSIMAAYRADPVAEKIDLSAGVYKDANGNTPVMSAVAEAEQKVLALQTSKAYIGLAGNPEFNATMQELMLGVDHPSADRARTFQTPGGSGGLRVAAEFLNKTRPNATIWISDPSWANHEPLIGSAGLTIKRYPYLDKETGGLRFDDMLATLTAAQRGDLVLLHGCCHNPTGVDLSPAQWDRLTEMCLEHGLIPFIDSAYIGFGDGIDEDAYGLRRMAASVPEAIMVSSCSKNFGLYKERVGAVTLIAADTEQADVVLSHMLRVVRRIYSMPPDHGGAIVGAILSDPGLRASWEEELSECRLRMQQLRRDFATELTAAMPGNNFDFLIQQKGMFSMLPITPAQADALMKEHHVYLVTSGRINVAGLPEDKLAMLAKAIAAVS